MNPQYMQQQHPLYRAPPTNGPYGELNANFPPKGQHDLHAYPPQKSPGPPPNNVLPPLSNAPPPTSNSRPPSSNALPPMSNTLPPMNNAVPPTSNAAPLNNTVPPTSSAPPVSRALYYANDAQGQATNVQQINQNNLVNQMSSMALSTQQRPPSSQGFSLPPEKSASPMPFTPAVNGINNENHYYPEDKSRSIPQKSLQKQGSPTSQMSSLPYSYGHPPGSQLSGQQQFPVPNQMLSQNSISGPNIPRSTPQPVTPAPSEQYNQVPNQRYSGSVTPQTDVAGPPVSGKRPGMPLSTPNTANQQSFGAPPLTGQTHPGSLQQTPLAPPTLNSQHHTSGPPLGGPPLSGPPLGGPPLSGPPMSGPPKNRQNLISPQLSGQNLQGPPNSGMPNLSRPPLSGQVNNLSGPPVSTQSNLANPYGQQNMSGLSSLPGQQNLCSHYAQSNQLPEQRKFSPSPSGQTNTYGHVNHPHSDLSYYQGYQQQNYSQSEQSNMYANQASPYQGGMSSPTGGYQSNTQAQQARRLDPDQMPSPIQVIQDDQKIKGGVFTTNQTGLVPPLVTTKFTVEDQGNASPRFIRSSMYTVPTTADIIKQTQVPFALILSPMAQVEEGEYEPPVVDMGEIGPVRCNRCKAYMSPFMQFIDAGRRFQCMFCKGTTEVPSEYFQHLDHTGQRLDRFERPELLLGTYEYLATKDYCRNNTFPKPPAIIFVIDVSYNTVKSGLVNLLCGHMKRIIRNLPVDIGQSKSNMKVGFITYSNTVQFYNLKANLAQPQMMIVGDVQDVFMPLLDGFLCDPEESEALIDSLMSQIPTMFGDTRETEIILAPAIQAGLDALKASDCTGKLMVFHSSLPITEAPGKLKNRDDRKLLGTDKEKTVLAPQTNFYNNLGQDCVGGGCSVDLFVFNNSYVDIATIGQVSRLTGGEIYKYTYFQADVDGERLITDIINNVSRPVAFDAVMRVRTSTGVRPTDFYGHLYMSNTTDIELASIDCDKAIAVEIKHDDKLSEEEAVYVQAALLYTSCSGVRRLRIINLSLKTSAQMAELYRACDLDAIINYLSKKSVFKLVESCPKTVKDSLNSRCAAILASYRKHCATPSSAGQLILPECMKLLPLYINGLLKSDAITGGSGITVDQKSYVMITVATMPISESVVHVYPRLLPLHDVDPQDIDLPPMLRCSIDKFTDDGAYLLENGIHMFLWLGSNLSSQWVQSVFGATSIAQVDTDRCVIPILENSLNKRIRHIISYVQSERRYCMRLTVLKQRDKMEVVMRQFLVEDRGADGSQSYVDFLCHMHREIRTLLS